MSSPEAVGPLARTAPMHDSWSLDARTVLEHACAWHGGPALFGRVSAVSLTPRRLEGLLPTRKGLRTSWPVPRRIDVFPHDRCTVLVDYPEPGYDGVFDNGHVWIRERATERVLDDSEDHGRTFAGFAKYRRWTVLDALFFLGYTTWHDHALPFTLGEARLVGLRTTGGQRPQSVLDVEFAPDVPTHGRRQSFYFDWAGRLQRQDYRAGLVGPWAASAHRWLDYQRIDGLAVAMEHVVTARLFGAAVPVTLLHVTYADASLVLDRTPSDA